jgi:hypothetical protein
MTWSVFFGCSHSIHQVHTSSFAPYGKLKAGKLIRAEAVQKSIMGFNRETDYVDEAYAKLQSKCKAGTIKSITTQFSTSHGFFHWHNKILMQGVCIRS